MLRVVIDTGNTRGVRRKLDRLNRVTIPVEFFNELKLERDSDVEIYLLDEGLFIKKI